MSGIWRCPVCEGVNQGGRTCSTCGEVVPHGAKVRAAVRTRSPRADRSIAPPVPPTPRRRELRDLPSPEELREVDPYDLLTGEGDFDIEIVPGGCLVPIGSRPRRRRRHLWF